MINYGKIIGDYLAAYKTANGRSQKIEVGYTRGWFTIRSYGAAIGTRHRRKEVEAMTSRLQARAAERS